MASSSSSLVIVPFLMPTSSILFSIMSKMESNPFLYSLSVLLAILLMFSATTLAIMSAITSALSRSSLLMTSSTPSMPTFFVLADLLSFSYKVDLRFSTCWSYFSCAFFKLLARSRSADSNLISSMASLRFSLTTSMLSPSLMVSIPFSLSTALSSSIVVL